MTPHELLESAMCDLFWLPEDVTVINRAELLALRCDRPIQMLNTVLRADAAPDRLDALVGEIHRFHAHTTSRWSVADTRSTAHIEASLSRGGYSAGHHHEARGIDVSAFRAHPSDITVERIDSVERMRECVDVANAAFERTDSFSDEQLASELAQCTGGRVHRFVAYDGTGAPIASASLTTFPDLRFGFLWGGGTVPSARGRGAYHALLARRVAVAQELGLSHVGLYARTATSAPIVTRCGFERSGEMTYWTR